jgi:hypothetical protein
MVMRGRDSREGDYRSGREIGIIGGKLYKTRDLVEPGQKRRENERRSILRTLDEHEEHDELPDS